MSAARRRRKRAFAHAFAPIALDPNFAVPESVSDAQITYGDIAVGLLVRNVSTAPLIGAAWKTWIAAAPGLSVLFLADCECQLPIECAGRSTVEELPSFMAVRSPDTHVRCYYGPRYRALNGTAKIGALWREMLALPRRHRFYFKIDLDTLLEPGRLLRLLNTLHAKPPPSLPNRSLVYIGSGEHISPVDLESLTPLPWWTDLAHAMLHEFGPIARANSTNRPLRRIPFIFYAQGGAQGLSLPLVEQLVRSDCLRHVGINAPKEHPYPHPAAEDIALGLCMHLFGVPLVTSPCFHPLPPCSCSYALRNMSAAMLSCSEKNAGTKSPRCLSGSVSMHLLKRPDLYHSCWTWQQRVLSLRGTVTSNKQVVSRPVPITAASSRVGLHQ